MSAADIADLAAACQAIGRSVGTAARVRELACAQDGLRLDALESDAAALSAAAAAAQEALDAAGSATGVLAQAWRSGTGSAATEFLRRQCASGSAVIENLTAAAATLRRLREQLARHLENQDAVTARIQAPVTWLSAARAVVSGRAGADAVGIVAGEIAPFVDTVVADQWVPTAQSATAGVSAAYRQAAAELADHAPVRFESPAMPSPAAPVPVSPFASTPSAPFSAPPMPSLPSVPDVGGAIPDLGGLLFPLVTAIAAALGGHSGSPSVDDGAAPPERGATGPAPEPAMKPEPQPKARTAPQPAAPLSAPLSAPLAAEAPAPLHSPPPVLTPETAPPLPLVKPDRTPCEIAADELPQVGP